MSKQVVTASSGQLLMFIKNRVIIKYCGDFRDNLTIEFVNTIDFNSIACMFDSLNYSFVMLFLTSIQDITLAGESKGNVLKL